MEQGAAARDIRGNVEEKDTSELQEGRLLGGTSGVESEKILNVNMFIFCQYFVHLIDSTIIG